ncbi:MAG: glycosyl hydrolase [Kiritimatiellae bacterium]|jgi:hypothetical protein|nr:glycosyl hydrolase [Kiritimatiellia bacterium]
MNKFNIIIFIFLTFSLQVCHAQQKIRAGEPQITVYRWAAPKGPFQVDTFAKWIDRPEVWGEDFFAQDTWDNISSPGWLLWPWQNWLKVQQGRQVLLSVPMLPGAWDRSGPQKGTDANKPVSLANGAKGNYNHYFRILAEDLVKREMVDKVIIRLGWEFNGGWYTWRAKDDTKSWAEYWRQIVTTMQKVKGCEKLRFCWNPALTWQQFPATQAYPGDKYVDIIGLDVYDESWGKDTYPFPANASKEEILTRQKRTWDTVTYGGSFGLRDWAEFARQHKKPMAICEWGVNKRNDGHGGLDNPYFVEQMYKFMTDPTNNVIIQCYFDVEAGDGKHQLSKGANENHQTLFPKSAKKYLELFGKRK